MNLKSIGLSDYESKIYLALILLGRCKAIEISKESKVPITAVYPNLKTLEEKGFIIKYLADQSLYEAIDCEKAISTFAQKKITDINIQSMDVIEKIKEMAKPHTENYAPLKISYGKEASISVLLEKEKLIRKTLYISGWTFTKTKSVHSFIHQARDLIRKKVEIKIIFREKREITEYLAKELRKIGVQVRFYDGGNFSIMIFDDESSKLSLKNETREQRINVLIEDKDYAKSMKEYFKTLWKKAQL